MIGTDLEFATGTTADCKKLVWGLFPQARVVLDKYRVARKRYRTRDIVLVTEAHDPSQLELMPRAHYISRIRAGGPNAVRVLETLTIAHQSAAQVASLPADSSAFWLVVNFKDAMPAMIVLFTIPYAVGADAREPTIRPS